MRIAIDLQGAQTASRYRGIGRYSISLAKSIAKNARGHEIFIIGNAALDQQDPHAFQQLEKILDPHQILRFSIPANISADKPENRWRNRAAGLLRENFLRSLDADLIFTSSLFEGGLDDACTSTGHLPTNSITSASLYDLIPMAEPAKYLSTPWVKDWYLEKTEDLQRHDQLLAISEFSKLQAQQLLGIESAKILNVSAACDELFRPQELSLEAAQEIKVKYGVYQKLIICSGALDERKNIARLLQAFSTLPAEIRSTYQLLLAGKGSAVEMSALCDIANKSRIAEQIILPGYVPDQDLVQLINLADFFIFPSLSEGFGLPPLEAMSCGTPTIASNCTSLPEVIGWADAMFDARNVSSIAEAMYRVATDRGFHAQLKAHAILQASKFSWDRSANLALDAFEQINQIKKRPSEKSSWPIQRRKISEQHAELVEKIAQIDSFESPPSDDDLRSTAEAIAENSVAARRVLCHLSHDAPISWRIEGPFDSTYSLALVNREMSLALSSLGQEVALHSSEGPGDFLPNKDFLANYPIVEKLYQQSLERSADQFDITTRDMFPPRVHDAISRVNLLHSYAWEESGFPAKWVDDFNEHLQGIGCISEHVKKILIDNGVTVPLWVNGCGVDHWERISPNPGFIVPGDGYRFLHVSSCFPRKGADVLLKAFGAAFSRDEPVCLIIKTFRNVHNRIHEWLDAARAENSQFPKVHIIEEDISDADLKALYLQCRALVAPSRAEGFGLPLAEAMLCGLEVITTEWSGQVDFCNPSTAWMVDYSLQRSESHLGVFDSFWAEPDQNHLSKVMRDVYLGVAPKKSGAGRVKLLGEFKWIDAAQKLIAGAKSIPSSAGKTKPRIGWVSTWNTKCGIATYSQHLTENFPEPLTYLAPYSFDPIQPDQSNVIRCWDQHNSDDFTELGKAIEENHLDTLVLQFNYGFFDFLQLRRFLEHQVRRGIVVVIVMHSTQDPEHAGASKHLSQLSPALKLCARIIAHSVSDLNRLKKLGITQNVMLFPHGVLDYQPTLAPPKPSKRFVLATYGFFLPHKGLLEFIEAVEILKNRGLNVEARMINAEYPISVSEALVKEARAAVSTKKLESRITLFTSFLDDTESLALLERADLIIFPYQNTGESASGAARYGLASRKPVAVTPLPIFDDITAAVHKLPGTSAQAIADGIEELMGMVKSDHPAITETSARAKQWIEEHRYENLTRRFANILRALKNNSTLPSLNSNN